MGLHFGEDSISKNEFIIAVRFILDSTFFAFNNRNYKQVFGTPMGSSLIIADIVMQDLEEIAFKKLSVHCFTLDMLMMSFLHFHPILSMTL